MFNLSYELCGLGCPISLISLQFSLPREVQQAKLPKKAYVSQLFALILAPSFASFSNYWSSPKISKRNILWDTLVQLSPVSHYWILLFIPPSVPHFSAIAISLRANYTSIIAGWPQLKAGVRTQMFARYCLSNLARLSAIFTRHFCALRFGGFLRLFRLFYCQRSQGKNEITIPVCNTEKQKSRQSSSTDWWKRF